MLIHLSNVLRVLEGDVKCVRISRNNNRLS